MLGGIAPIIIFTFSPLPSNPVLNAIAGIPLVGQAIASNVGIPIPVYLDEQFSGVCVESQSKAIDIESEIQTLNNGKGPIVSQKGLGVTTTVNLIAKKDSILLSILLALSDQIFDKVTAQNYSISYLNGASTVFNGLLHSFNAQESAEDTLVRVSFSILRKTASSTRTEIPTESVSAVTGATPLGG